MLARDFGLSLDGYLKMLGQQGQVGAHAVCLRARFDRTCAAFDGRVV